MPFHVAVTTSPTTTLAGATVSIGSDGASAASASATRILGFVTLPPERVSVIGRPVLCKTDSTSLTVAVGIACLRTAHVPAAWGAAIDVPLAMP
jgi:hypothetical protein